MASGGGGRRHQNNLQGLLKFCLEATQSDDATTESNFSEMDRERREWLQEALQHMTVDVIKQMQELCLILLNDDEHDVDVRGEALEKLTDICVDLDLAQDFQKIGGFSLLPKLLEDPSPDIKWRTGDLIAALVQNNPYCQRAALDMEIFPTLLNLVDNDPSDIVKVKSLYATSSLCRNLPEAEKAFIDLDGFSFLMRAMQTKTEKLQTKAVFLLMHFSQDPTMKETLFNMGMVEQLVALLNTQHSGFHEHLLSALIGIVRGNPKYEEECRRPELQLHSVLEKKVVQLKGKEEYLEEYEHSKKLMDLVFSESAEDVCR